MSKQPFSKRNGYVAHAPFDMEAVSDQLRMRLLNETSRQLTPTFFKWESVGWQHELPGEVQWLWGDLLGRPLTDIGQSRVTIPTVSNALEQLFLRGDWFAVFDAVECAGKRFGGSYRAAVTSAMEQEGSPYRLLGEHVAPIAETEQLDSVAVAMDTSGSSATHIQRALKHFASRGSPDFANAIKEAISAVEAEVRLLCGDDSATLGDGLKRCGDLHPALRKGMSAIYGYAGDGGGIRHARGESDRPPTRAEARLMLVTCSSLVTFLREHRTAASIEPPHLV